MHLFDKEVKNIWWKAEALCIPDSTEQLAVLIVRNNMPSDRLRSIGHQLQSWQEHSSKVVHIWGLRDLLDGCRPRTPPTYFSHPYFVKMSPDNKPDLSQSYEPVGLVLVSPHADKDGLAISLQESLRRHLSDGLSLTTPDEYFLINR